MNLFNSPTKPKTLNVAITNQSFIETLLYHRPIANYKTMKPGVRVFDESHGVTFHPVAPSSASVKTTTKTWRSQFPF